MGVFKKIPPLSKFRHLPEILSLKERVWLAVFGLLFIGSFIYILTHYYFSHTHLIADFGGGFSEGIVGEPQFLNPLLSQKDADGDLQELIFSGLVKYDRESEIIPDLAKSWKISEDGRSYTVSLRDDVYWHDGQKFNADDVIFTIGLIQNDNYKSPLRFNWQGVKKEKIDDYTVKFDLLNPYAPFLRNLTLKILPRHIWENVPAKSFTLAGYNLKPVGTGPYFFESFQKDKYGSIKSYALKAFPEYFLGKPHIETIKFYFFDGEESLASALNKKQIEAGGGLQSKNLEKVNTSGLSVLSVKMPRYFAVFFNPAQSRALADKSVRQAMNLAADKAQIIEKVLTGRGTPVDSPILPGSLGYGPTLKKYGYDPAAAADLLEKAGWKINYANQGIREKIIGKDKTATPLEIALTIPQGRPDLIETATILRDEWKAIGIKTILQILEPKEIQDSIKERNYEAIIYGEILPDPDPFPFWHSSQKNDPGLNLAMYDNKQADKLLEEARQILKETDRAQKYEDFQKIIIEDAPAVFLFSPDYLYAAPDKIKGLELRSIVLPAKRFDEIEKWYIKTKRVWE